MGDLKSKFGHLFSGIKKAAGEAMESSEAAVSRGKTAAKAIYSDSGELIVDAGHIIDEAVIAKARSYGKLGALAATAVTSKAQDLRDKTRAAYAATPEGAEAKTLASSDQYIEARGYIGRIAIVEVMDMTGQVVIPAGKKIVDEDVRAAREAEQLGALIASAQKSPPLYTAPPPPAQPVVAAPPTEAKRAARPLSSYYDDEEETGEKHS